MHGTDLHPGCSTLLQTPIFTTFSGNLYPSHGEASGKVTLWHGLFLQRWLSFPSTNSQRVWNRVAWTFFLVESYFAEYEIKKKHGLSLFSQVKQRLIAPSKHLREAGLCKEEDKADSRTKWYKQASFAHNLQINRFLTRARMRLWNGLPVGTGTAGDISRFKIEHDQLMKEIK